MKQPPTGAVFETQQFTRVDFLAGVLGRLQSDVGTILNLVDAHNSQVAQKSQRIIGFWACLRMILPIIEAVAHAQGYQNTAILLRNELNIPTSYLAWHLFRHSLMHGDLLHHGVYQDKNVSWGASFMHGAGHVIGNGVISLDIQTLYNDLEQYLQQEVAKNDQTLINIEVGILYQNPTASIKADFAAL